MKQQFSLVALLAALALTGPLGCGKNDSTGAGAGSSAGGGMGSAAAAVGLDLSKIEGAFASATGPLKAEFDKAVAAVKAGDYSGALATLQSLGSNVGLSGDQKTAVSDLLAQVKAKAGDLMKSAGTAAGQAVDQAKEAAGKAATQATDAASKAAGQAGDAVNKAAGDASKAAGGLLPK